MAKRSHNKRPVKSPDLLKLRRGAAKLAIGLLALYGSVNLGAQAEQTFFSAEPLEQESAKITIPWISDTITHWQAPIVEMATKYDIDPDLLAIIMTLESGGYAKAGSSAGAEGLMQITPATASDIAAKYLKEPRATYDIWDPATNIEFGAAYLAHLRDVFENKDQGPSWDETVELVAAGYNGGPGAANSLLKGEGLQSVETVSYSRDAFNMWRERHAKASPTYERWLERGGQGLIDAAKAEK